jgi:diketogulonate reductase-like aldo/keto reductase
MRHDSYCEQHDLVFLPWRPLGGLGLSHRLGEIQPLRELARERGLSPQCLVIAWQLAKSKCILPIPGSRRRDHVLDCLAAAEVQLEPSEVRRLDAVAAPDLPRRDRPTAWEGMPP